MLDIIILNDENVLYLRNVHFTLAFLRDAIQNEQNHIQKFFFQAIFKRFFTEQ